MTPVESYRRGVHITRMALDGQRLAKGHNPSRNPCNITEERR